MRFPLAIAVLASLPAAAALIARAKLPIIIAPAQFGVPKDYEKLRATLLARGHPSVTVAPLTRFDWLKIVPSLFTGAFWRGELRPTPTLNFFFEALDDALAGVGPDEDVAILGHSIGGWVARAYVGSRGESRAKRLVTLGTPHVAPSSGLAARLDQTRGLLKYINAEYPADPATTVCVAGEATASPSFFDLLQRRGWDEAQRRSPLLEGLVALPSYAVLAGGDPFKIKGDGLIPVQTACLPGIPSIVVDCHHADFVPTALDSIVLPDTYRWFGSPGIVEKWAGALDVSI